MAQPVQPRALGKVSLSVKSERGKTALENLRQSGSLRCLFPRPDTAGLEAVLVNTAGGITGGDRFHVTAQVAAGCSLTLTTQACERAYRAQPDQSGRLHTHLNVAKGAHLNWLPQETILFNDSRLERSLTLNLAPNSSALLVEPMVFGRQAMGEALTNLRLRDRIEIRRDNRPLFLDATRFDGDMAAHLDIPHIAAGARAMALVVYIDRDAQNHLAAVRAMLPEHAGATLIGDDLLVARILADDSYLLRQDLIPILKRLSNNQLPKCWMI
ncbi:MAG: urease accessory protein UreD [Octadecabacter sp.]|nr:urease accessory protein UreD [Octadecabacter sp.]